MDVREARARAILARRAEPANVFPSLDEAARRLATEQGLTFYFGIDPTSPQIHLGHTIPLLLLGDIVRLGHKGILLIGDFTARIGDPTEKEAVRTVLTTEQVAENLATYVEQAKKVVPDVELEVRYNSEWLASLNLSAVLRLTNLVTVQQMMAREMFQERQKQEKPIYVSEFLYPLMQGYDSVALRADGEVGGNDQTFNMLVGRDLEQKILGKDKMVISARLLVDVATGKKMSKTEGAVISIDDPPQEIRRKVLALDDSMTRTIFELCTQKDTEWIQEHAGDPRAFKETLADELVRMYHGDAAAGQAREPVVIEHTGALDGVIKKAGAAANSSEAKRLIDQGAVEVNGVLVKEWKHQIQSGDEIRVGKGKFYKVQ